MIRYRDSHCPREADQAYLDVFGVSVSSKQQRSHKSLWGLWGCKVMPSSSYPCQGGQEAPAHQWEHEVPLGPGATHHQIETRNVRNRRNRNVTFLSPKESQRCNDSSQWWHKSWIWVCIHVTEAAANINAMSFCNFVLDSKGVRILVSKLTLQERSQFMKEEASQLYTTVVIRHSADLTAYFCVNLQNLMMSINVISHLAPGTC